MKYRRLGMWGLKLSEIQNRLSAELGMALTYMQVRLLVDDLKLTPKDVEPPKPSSLLGAAGPPPPAGAQPGPPGKTKAPHPAPGPAPARKGVSVTVDQLTRPGAVVSGKVTFSDGITAVWQIDQAGRLGLAPQQAGYRPPQSDLQEFQMALDTELSRLGF